MSELDQNEVDYEKKYHLEDKHQTLLKIIAAFDKVCTENGIHYSLSCGTLLGAVRHGGFIPWDDDADIMMTREEYDKLLTCVPKDNQLEIVKTTFLDRITIVTDNPAKIYVDLFLFDRMPNRELMYQVKKDASILLRCYFVNKKQLYHAWNHNTGSKKVAKSISVVAAMLIGACERQIFRNKSIWALHDRIVATPKEKASSRMKKMTDEIRVMKKYTYQAAWFENYTRVPFCGKQFMIIKDYESYLTYLYKDYMTWPPEEKRVPNSHLSLSEDQTAERLSKVIKII